MRSFSWIGFVVTALALDVGLSNAGCSPPETCLPPSVRYMGRCLPPCIEGDVNYCVQSDGAVVVPDDDVADVTRADGDGGSSMDVVCPNNAPVRCGEQCVDLTNSAANCGRCGNSCTGGANATGVCMMGTCEIQCSSGFANCDGVAANGCETNLNDDATHCGSCSRTCTGTSAPPNATPRCAMGSCAIASCTAGFGDCDMNVVNGCEANFMESVRHCGACGTSCPTPTNAAAICTGGSCGLGECNAGFANCDMNAANGCETSTDFAVANCGRCGNICPSGANGGAACVMGACTLSCAMGFRLLGGACVSETAAPRPIAPISLGDVSLRRPTLRWQLTGGFDGAVVELCRDRACTSVIETIRTMGTSARPTAALPPRSTVFWRLRGRVGAADAMVNSPTWLFHVPAADNSGGIDTSYSPHLDVNGDGFDDVAIGAPGAAPRGRVGAGTVSVFLGGAMGLSAAPVQVLEGLATNDLFGTSVGAAGDVNGDGFGDLIVGAYGADPGGRMSAGSASIFHGSNSGITANAATTIDGVAPSDFFGFSVAGIGDANADGFADVAVGAYLADPAARDGAGSVSIFHGSVAGVNSAAVRVLDGVAPNNNFGRSLAPVGDVNGDGFSDLAVGAPAASPAGRNFAGSVSIFVGSLGGVSAAAQRVIDGVAANDAFGRSVAGAGDVNADGYTDVIVGADGADPAGRLEAGSASIFHGSAGGIAGVAARVLEGLGAGDNFGRAVAGARDVNGDGFSDVICGAENADPAGRSNAGSASVFHGSAVGIAGVSARVLDGVVNGDNFGHAVASAGDINADGYSDLSVGAFFASPGARNFAGSSSVFVGSMAGIPAVPLRVIEGSLAFDNFGAAVAFVSPRPIVPHSFAVRASRRIFWSMRLASL